MKSKLASVSALGLMMVALCGGDCEPIDATYVAPGDGNENGDGNDGPYTTPEALITAHETAWSERDYDAYAALLADDFEFYPLQEDADDLPWMTGDSWSRSDELGMIAHMFDPTFTGGQGSVDLIELDAVIQSTETNDQGRTEVNCIVQGRVMWTATDGASFDTRLEFELVESGGSLLIREITEIPRTATGRGSISVEASSLGSIKNLYR